MAKMDKAGLIRAIYSELDRATDYSTAQLREIRAQAWNYYLQRPRGDEIEGRSAVQDSSVRDVVHALLAQIMPAYASDSIISFEPDGPNDVDQADAESRAVNALFTETNQGFLQLAGAVQDALLFRNGVIKVWAEKLTEVTTRRFRAPAADVLAQAAERFPDQAWEHTGTDANGLNSFKVKQTRQHLRTDAIEQALLFVDPNQSDQSLHSASFIAEQTWLTRSDLVEMGVNKKIVYDLHASIDKSTSDTGVDNVDLLAKFIGGVSDVGRAGTPDQDEIECFWVYQKLDRDGDGIAERYRFLVSDREILLDEPVEFFPYASGSGWPVPHRWSGLGVYDLNKHTQDEMTNARRQFADNLNVANNQRPVFDPGTTNAQDVANGAPGRGIRSTDPMSVHFMPVADVTSQSITFLQYMSSVRSEQTGAALDMQSADGQLLTTASGISAEMQLAPRELMAAHISRNIAETLVRNLFLLIHRTLRTEWEQPLTFQKAGDWQQTNPGEWQPRDRINVNVGLSPGERRRKSAALQQVLQIQMGMIQGGTANITTTWSGVHACIRDWMNSVELTGSEVYFLDPDGQESQQGQQMQGQQAQAQGQQQQQLQQFMMQLEAQKIQIDQTKVENERLAKAQELQWKYFDTLVDADAEAQRLELDAIEGSRQPAEEPAGRNGADRKGTSKAVS